MDRNLERPKRGHLVLKSSVLAPTSTSYFNQHMVLNHLNSHYRRISSAKAAVDTSAPKSMKKHIKVKDQIKRQSLKDNSGSLTPGRLSQSASLENLSSRKDLSHSRPQSRPGSAREVLEYSTPLTTPRDDLSAHDQYLLHQQRQKKLDSLSDGWSSLTPRQQIDSVMDGKTSLAPERKIDGVGDRQTFHTPLSLPKPLVSQSRWKRIQSKDKNFDSNNNIEEDFTSATTQEFRIQSTSSPRSIMNGGLASYRSSRMSEYPGLDSSFNSMSSAYARRKKELQTKMWREEQMYMEFISEVTSDVLARGIFTNRVLNKVFNSHVEKRRDELDEQRMRDMIDQLKLDLDITDN